jgi:branched-subunit amino acid aminotransferase/4-amino-4-deoxychorismate lyase
MRVVNGRPFRWAQHIDRLQSGAEFLKIKIPFPAEELRTYAGQLIRQNQLPDSILRLTLSRGFGARGYSPKGATQPTLVMSLHPAPAVETALPQWKLITAQLRLPVGDPLAQFKTCNKLWQILARAEADTAQADEALLLNTDGHVAEATSANVFWTSGGVMHTPPLDAGILPGVTRAAVLQICSSIGAPLSEMKSSPDALQRSDGMFLALSSWGVVEVVSLDNQPVRRSPMTEMIQRAYLTMLRTETV